MLLLPKNYRVPANSQRDHSREMDIGETDTGPSLGLPHPLLDSSGQIGAVALEESRASNALAQEESSFAEVSTS
jgi:hypothetical protein